MVKECCWFKHSNTAVRMMKNHYGNPSGTFNYVQGFLEYLTQNVAECNEKEPFLVQLESRTATVITEIAVYDFLSTSSENEAMDEFHSIMKVNYDIYLLGRPKRFLGWYFHHQTDVTIALSQGLIINKTLVYSNILHVNGKGSPYPKDKAYHVDR